MKYLYVLCTVSLTALFSCSGSDQQAAGIPGKNKNGGATLAGQVYYYAPQFDTTSCSATGDCDCCSGYVAFVNDSVFVLIDQCEASTMYYKGTYRFVRENLIIASDSIFVTRDYDPTDEATERNNERKYVVNYSIAPPFAQRWKGFRCQGKLCFVIGARDRQYVTPDAERTADDMIDQLKTDGVWEMLSIDKSETEVM